MPQAGKTSEELTSAQNTAKFIDVTKPKFQALDDVQSPDDLLKTTQFQKRVSTMGVPLNGTRASMNQIVQRVEAGNQPPVNRQEDFKYLQRTIGNKAFVQLLDNIRKTKTENIHQTAAASVHSTCSQLPHLDAIQHSFGQHDVRSMQGFTRTKADAASVALFGQAYTTKNKNEFSSRSRNLHTTAHEVTHVVQQQNGMLLDMGVGNVADKYEPHADAVADSVVKGRSAGSLINHLAGLPENYTLLRKSTPAGDCNKCENGENRRSVLTDQRG